MLGKDRTLVGVNHETSSERLVTFGPLRLLAQCVLLFSATIVSTEGQQLGFNYQKMRDKVREIERVEMDRQLLLKPLPPTKDDSVRQALMKQIRDDFRDIQDLNNKMMADAWSREEPNYEYISDMVSQIRGKANRLKSNLLLPEVRDSEKKEPHLASSNAKEFRATLLVLDKSIMSFVTNPIFRENKVVEMKMATQASRDLEAVLRLSGHIKKAASNLNKKSKDGH